MCNKKNILLTLSSLILVPCSTLYSMRPPYITPVGRFAMRAHITNIKNPQPETVPTKHAKMVQQHLEIKYRNAAQDALRNVHTAKTAKECSALIDSYNKNIQALELLKRNKK